MIVMRDLQVRNTGTFGFRLAGRALASCPGKKGLNKSIPDQGRF